MPHLNGVIEWRFEFIKEVELAMLLNAKLNDTSQNILWTEALHTCERVWNSMITKGSTNNLLEILYG